MKHFFIIAGGKIEDAFAIEVLKGFAEKTVIAADSGMEFLRRNEIVPQVIIGDFDSVSKETLEWFQKKEGIVWHRLNPQKDDTDTELEKAIEKELKEKELALFVLAITDILNSNSEILVLGEKSSVVEKAFDKKLENNRAFLEGVVSRKKQLLPNIDKNI